MRDKRDILKDVDCCLRMDCEMCSLCHTTPTYSCNGVLREEVKELAELLEREEDDLK